MQVDNRMGIPPYNSGYTNRNKSVLVAANSEFQKQVEEKGDENRKSFDSVTKEEILKKFPDLSEEDFENIIANYDIDSMDSSELYKLADELMKKKVIPSYAHQEGLDLVAVYPKALYDSFRTGDNRSSMGGIITVAPDFLYSANPSTGEFTFHGYPKFGMKYLQYGIRATQEAMKVYDSYYTDQERNHALQVAESKKAFYELADMLSSYQKNS